MKYTLWVHARDKNDDTVEHGVIAGDYFGNKQAAKDGLWPRAMALVRHTDVQVVDYKIFKESSLTPVSTGVLHAVSIKPEKESEDNDADLSE